MPQEILRALKSKENITPPYEVFDILADWMDDCTYMMNLHLNVGQPEEAEKWKKSVLEINNIIVGITSPFTDVKIIKHEEDKDGINE